MFKIHATVFFGIVLLLSSVPLLAQRKDPQEKGGPLGRKDPTPTPTPKPPPTIPIEFQPPTTAGVRVFNDWPTPSGKCDFTLMPQGDHYQGLPNPLCNDTTSGVDVPFGMSLEICEHDGRGPKGLGRCRRFLPGTSGVGGDMNDKGTSFKVENRMIGYVNSKDFSAEVGSIMIGISVPTTGANPSGTPQAGQPNYSPGAGPTGWIKMKDGYINEDYNIPLPSYCPRPRVIELTKANDASWGSHVTNNILWIGLSAHTTNSWSREANWVGVEVLCN